jgi:signal transduction histidine kinase
VRRQLLLTVAASTLVVLVAFLVPLAWLVRSSTEDRATSQATVGVQPLAALVGVSDPAAIALAVAQVRASVGEPVTVFFGNGTVIGDRLRVTDSVRLARLGQAFSVDLPDGSREVLIPVAGRPEGTAVVRVEIPPSALHRGVTKAWLVLGALGVTLLLLALLVADALARSFLRPVHALTETASRLGTGDLTARVRPGGPQEVADAGRALNRLATRIDALLTAEREAVADLSHRLRTPVSALRLDADELRDQEEREHISKDVEQLSRAVDQLIDEARRPVREGVVASCDAVAVVADRSAFWKVLADDTERRMTVETPSRPVPVRLSDTDLANALDALLENVFAHTPDGTPVTVRLLARPEGGGLLVVEDDGPGPPGPDLVRRGESTAGSTGLGLDIVRRSAEASGGGLQLATGVTGGLRAVVELGPPYQDDVSG